MRNRILSIVLALSMIAVLFAAIPTKAAIDYTGTVTTTDNTGAAKTDYIQGEAVYVKVNVLFDGAYSSQQIRVSLVPTTGGGAVSSFTTNSNNPVVGWYNSTVAGGLTLFTGAGFTGDVQSYDVIVVLPAHGNLEIARTHVVVRATGVSLTPTPNNPAYWPGETVTIHLVIAASHTADLFYVQVTNSTEFGAIGTVTYQNFTDQAAPSGYWSMSFTIGSDWPDGTYHLTVRDKATSALWFPSVHFDVQAYVFMAMTPRDNYMPGETVQVSYLVLDLATLAPITSGITIYYNVSYQNTWKNNTLFNAWINGTLSPAENLWLFTIPTNGTNMSSIALFSDVNILLNATQATGHRSATESIDITIGSMDGSVSLNSNSFHPGDTVEVTVHADVNGDSLDNASVNVSVIANGTEVIAAYSASGLLTDQNGEATYVFKLANSVPQGRWNYIVRATISKVGYSAVRENQFQVTPSVDLLIAFDRDYYYGGQAATVTFKGILNGEQTTTGSIGYIAMLGSQLVANGTTTSNSATIAIPEKAFGTLDVDAFTLINGEIAEDFASVDVVFAELGLTTENSAYRPGETITFQWTIVTGQTSASLSYEIIDSDGVRVANGTPAFAKTGSFEYVVPAASPLLPTSYDATLRMTTPEGGFASGDATVDIVSGSGNELVITLGKSSYTTGEFRPGQKVTINYDLKSFLTEPRPSIRLHVSVSYDPIGFDVIVSSATGKISYSIPKDAPMAPHTVTVWAYDAATGEFLAADSSVFQVNNQVSGWQSSVGGISAIDLILLVLLIIVIIMLIVVPMMKDRMATPKPPESKPMVMDDSGKTPPAPPSP